MAQQLANEVGRGEIALDAQGGLTTFIIRVERQFASGGAQPDAAVRPIIEKIAAALESVPGAIVVTAHTDALPIKSSRYPSNRELSAARAQSVAQLISAKLSDPRRVTSVGAGESDPVAANDSEENRARNRRVVINLRHLP